MAVKHFPDFRGETAANKARSYEYEGDVVSASVDSIANGATEKPAPVLTP